jgi:hypothetical protein
MISLSVAHVSQDIIPGVDGLSKIPSRELGKITERGKIARSDLELGLGMTLSNVGRHCVRRERRERMNAEGT